MGSSEPESEGELGKEVGLAMRAQLVLSLHYLYLLQLFTCQCLLHRLGCITGLNKDRYLYRTQEGLGKLQEICAWDQARPCRSPALLPLVSPWHTPFHYPHWKSCRWHSSMHRQRWHSLQRTGPAFSHSETVGRVTGEAEHETSAISLGPQSTPVCRIISMSCLTSTAVKGTLHFFWIKFISHFSSYFIPKGI